MRNLKFIVFTFLVILLTNSTCFAYQYNQTYPYYPVGYSDVITKPTPITMPQANYYNDWNFNTNSYTQNNNSNYNYQYNNNNYDSGSIHFIYSSSPNPTYCIPGSSYSICH